MRPAGKVFLVGAGPGDPALITRRGEELLRRADCVIYDRLVNPQLLKWIPKRCERIYAGKHSDEGGYGQERINRLLIAKARRYRIVVRLKGGDPSLFGRLAEETEALANASISYEVIPGISSVWAAAAALGIPLTDRALSSSVAFVTGHGARGKGSSSVRWRELARGADTLVILMGWSSLNKIVGRLRSAGRPASTPVALVRQVSLPEQAVLISSLGGVKDVLNHHPEFGPPVVVIVGEVVRKIRPPLDGKKILITRPQSDSAEMRRRFEERGAHCVHLPTIQVRPRSLRAAEKQALAEQLRGADWVLFNSHHAVESIGRLVRVIRGKICVIGPRTEAALRKAGAKADLVPAESSGTGVARAFKKIQIKGQRIVIPRSSLGIGDALAKSLKRRGALVREIPVYDTRPVVVSAATLRRTLKDLDAVTFTSASTARSFLGSLKKARLPLSKVLNGTPVVAIGPSTAAALRAGGIRRPILPEKGHWTLEGLVEAVEGAVKR